RWLKLVERHNRPGARIDDFAAHAEIAKHVLKGGCILPYCLHARSGPFRGLRRRQETERGQLISVGAPAASRCGLTIRFARRGGLSLDTLSLVVRSLHRLPACVAETGLGS